MNIPDIYLDKPASHHVMLELSAELGSSWINNPVQCSAPCSAVLKSCALTQGTCQEENRRIETFFDNMRKRMEALTTQQEGTERRFASAELPWDKQALRRVRIASLNLSTLSMSK